MMRQANGEDYITVSYSCSAENVNVRQIKAFLLMTRSDPPFLGNLSDVATVIFAISEYLQLNVNLVEYS